jgi:hypothetical protein
MTIPRILRRVFPGITLLLIALIAYLQARGIMQLLTLALGGPGYRGSSLPPPHDRNPPEPAAPKSGHAIIERNPFDSMPGPLRDSVMRDSLAKVVNSSAPLSGPSFLGLPAPVSPFVGSAATPRVGPRPLAQLGPLRIVPEQKGGKVVGLRLFGVRPTSLLGTLGLKNGDRLDSVNGFEVGNPEKALEAYARLRNASRLQLRLDRAGQPVQIDLNII